MDCLAQEEGRQLLTAVPLGPPGRCLPPPRGSPVHPSPAAGTPRLPLGVDNNSFLPALASDAYILGSIDQSCPPGLLSQIYACMLLEDRDLVLLSPFPFPLLRRNALLTNLIPW